MTPRSWALAGMATACGGALLAMADGRWWVLFLVGLVVLVMGLRRWSEPGAKVSQGVIDAGLVAPGDRPGPGRLVPRNGDGRAFDYERDGAA